MRKRLDKRWAVKFGPKFIVRKEKKDLKWQKLAVEKIVDGKKVLIIGFAWSLLVGTK